MKVSSTATLGAASLGDKLRQAYAGRRVFITGHTGFKGAWLSEWLLALGAEVAGYALATPTKPALFQQLELAGRLRHHQADVLDLEGLTEALRAWHPDYVFHLAAQTIVRASYDRPVETFTLNVLGTVNLLEALRSLKHPCAAIMVTSDKCYANREWLHGYRETDPMGGDDPYSASKGMAELATHAYRHSFFRGHPVRIASARAGNVIGGGDWARDRIVPDCIRALQSGQPIRVRNPGATRPWQHVLEPLGGYLLLAARLASADEAARGRFEGAFNFGPPLSANVSVRRLVEEILRHWPGTWEDQSAPGAVHEATRLHLASDKAFHLLGWQPRWSFEENLHHTVHWYRALHDARGDASGCRALTRRQIDEFAGPGPGAKRARHSA